MISTVTAAAMVLACVAVPVRHAVKSHGMTAETSRSGTLENNNNELTYTISPDGTTVISGTGFISAVNADIRENASAITLSEGITYISNSAFSYCKKVKEIKLPSTLQEIKDAAFMNCDLLEKITIPAAVTKVGEQILEYCGSLKRIENLSQVQVPVPQYAANTVNPFDYYVNGKKITAVKTGETACGRLKTTAVRLQANGGKISGKKKLTYTFGKSLSLPKAKKKGYIFMGWGETYSRKGRCNGIGTLTFSGENIMSGVIPSDTVTLYAYYIKKSTKVGKHSVKFTIKGAFSGLAVEYASRRDMSDKKMTVKCKKGASESTRIITLKNLKKGNYYVRFRAYRVLQMDEEPYYKYVYSRPYGKTKIRVG